MKFKNILFLTGMLLPASSVFAQYAEDALRFSQSDYGATARFRGLGGAQSSLGGDISALSSNPAGLGLFTRSEFSLTPEFTNVTSKSQFLGANGSISRGTAGLNQIGIVIYNPTRKFQKGTEKTGWISTNLALSYTKNSNFYGDIDYSGENNTSSYADYLSSLANRYLPEGDPEDTEALPEGSLERMAYQNFLIEYNPDSYFATTNVNPGTVSQRNLAFNTGSQSEFNVGLSTNFNNELYLGASIGFASIRFNTDREFIERGTTRSYSGQPAELVNAGYESTYRSNQETQGSGINLKFGAIYRPAPFLRVGANYATATNYSLSDEFSEELETQYKPANGAYFAPYTNIPTAYPLDYKLKTPAKISGGLSVILNKFGLLTSDIEYVDYSMIKFNSSDDIVDNDMKRSLRDSYQGAVNYKLGFEAKIHPLIQLRAGYNKRGNPYRERDYDTTILSTGLGYRVKNLSFDIAFTTTNTEFSPKPYVIPSDYPDFGFTGSGPTANIKNTTNNVFATLGLRF